MTVTAFEIPLSGAPQTFSIPLANVSYNLTFTWRDGGVVCPGGWVLDIADVDGVPLACGIALTTGRDLLEEYAYIGINGALVVISDGDTYAPPTFTNLGTSSHLYFVTDV